MMMLDILRQKRIPHQIIFNKLDERLAGKGGGRAKLSSEQLYAALQEMHKEWVALRAQFFIENDPFAPFDDLLGCSSVSTGKLQCKEPVGIDAVRWAVLQAVGKDCYENGKPKRYVVRRDGREDGGVDSSVVEGS